MVEGKRSVAPMADHYEQEPSLMSTGQFVHPETGRLAEPKYPILDKAEIRDGVADMRDQLTAAEQAGLRPDEAVIHIHERRLELPRHPVTPLTVLMKAAKAATPEEIGYQGPTVASVNLAEGHPRSRYERQHGRDDLIAGDDVKELHPKLLDTVVVSLAGSQGIEDEPFIAGQPYGFEKPGSIILVHFPADDPLGRKFQDRKDWKPRFYGSADAPGLFVNAIADLEAANPGYLLSRTYDALDGNTYLINHAFDLSVQWLLDRLRENDGLIMYRNPYTNGRGMRNQGWKDSADAMVHASGEWANSFGGVAPIEIQCQAVTSLRKAAGIYRGVYKNEALALRLHEQADRLRSFILERGFVRDAQHGDYFAMGWDRGPTGKLRRLETRSIDMHSVLRLLDMADPAQRAQAFATVQALTAPDMFTRWGNRVMSSRSVTYGDLRYHCSVWPDKSNRVAESMAAIGFFGLDRFMGGRTTELIKIVGCVPEHISGKDSIVPIIPTKDVYVYDRRYDEVHLAEQAPPLGQTWGATSELAKQQRYVRTPEQAEPAREREFEARLIEELATRCAA
jgi:hypothetical protein